MVSKHTYFYVLFSRSADFQKTVQKLDFRWVRNTSPPPWLGGRWQAVGREGGGGGGGGGWWCAGGVLVVCWWYGVKEFGFDIYIYIYIFVSS